ncbi:ATPase, histidine kinase-, DNA gyrase B-, and HSP90-like domain protein [Calothrix parasitica NIES-267]|uniref:histidine kinase n=1 Tax=Calothrix parasitica NIES-267 TaxID=1973488 RepID=A0A1Z4M1L5_9CYAN|nr:ATPase, histidine kinase-, DNA gyrase B-, and HSP90-like domain protein [Calothrix parasitica NIES-267]
MEAQKYEQKIKELEKTNRILQKKLERSQQNQILLEKSNDKKEFLLKKVITELGESKLVLEQRSQALQDLLQNLQAMQAQLVESEKMSALGVMVAGVAHEINNPIGFIYGNLNHVSEYAEDLFKLLEFYQKSCSNPISELEPEIEAIELDFIKEDFPKLLNSMKIGAERIKQIILSLRNFSRLDEAEIKDVDIHDGLDSTLMILQNQFKSQSHHSGIKIIKEYDKLPRLECYAGQLNQVFMNIIVNAIDALEKVPNPQIKISTESQENLAIIKIADNGMGINPEVQQKIFNPFFTTKPVGKGTGLGLSTSYKIIVDKHQGKLECHSNPGIGTEFLIALPLKYRGK